MTRDRFISFSKRAAVLIVALFFCTPSWAQDAVTIQKGSLTLTGDVLGYDGTYLRLKTDVGEVTLDFTDVTCTGAMCPESEDYVPALRLSGASRLSHVLLPALIDGYARAHGLRAVRRDIHETRFEYDVEDRTTGLPILRFLFDVSTSDQGFADLLADKTDVALSVREVRPDEVNAAFDRGLGRLNDPRRSEIIALDALVPISSPRRPVVALSIDQIAALFAGEITDWRQLGQAAGPVALHLMPETSGHTQDFVDRVLRPRDLSLSPDVQFHADPADLAAAVAMDAGAVGIVPFDSYGLARPMPLGGACGMLARADLRSLKTEDYPLTEPLFMYLPQRRLPPEAAVWLGWLRSTQAQRIVRRAGFVDRGPIQIPLGVQGDRLSRAIKIVGSEISVDDLQTMMSRLADRVRLSTTFRFNPGSTRLDAQSRSNMMQLGRAILDGEFDGVQLSLVGFSDGQGPSEANRTLSLARAESVRRELVKALGGALPDGTSIEIDAFGEALPLACDDSDWGRQTNRRVELWVRSAL